MLGLAAYDGTPAPARSSTTPRVSSRCSVSYEGRSHPHAGRQLDTTDVSVELALTADSFAK